MTAGYSGTPLVKKLGIKPGYKIMTVNEPEHYFSLLGELSVGIKVIGYNHSSPADFIHLFAQNEKTLHAGFPPLKEKLAKDGMLWVSWIKGSSKRDTDISGNDVRNLGLELGLVDIKVCAVDKDWSGLKFVFRREDR